ncbi:phage holin family protein [Candidatus Saccharibacteria bacterium]|nr:phage holin family protein [Candidatus Saccharibacteria bacterium]
MIKQQIIGFLFGWALSTLGMWISITLFGTITGNYNVLLFVAAGFIFSVVNAIIRPLATVFALPLIIFTLGLFTIIINTAMVALTIWIIPEVTMDFWGAVLSSLVMSMVNGLVNFWTTPYNRE